MRPMGIAAIPTLRVCGRSVAFTARQPFRRLARVVRVSMRHAAGIFAGIVGCAAPNPMPSLAVTVVVIVCTCTEKQVIGADTRRIVAMMADYHVSRQLH